MNKQLFPPHTSPNGSHSCHTTTPFSNLKIRMGKHKHDRRSRRSCSSSPSSSSSSKSSRSRSRSRSHSCSTKRKHKRSRNNRSRSRSPHTQNQARKERKPKTPTTKPYSAPTEPGRCAHCDSICKFTITSERNKEHPLWPYWKCSKCPDQDSFNGWIHEGPLPPNTSKGISFLSNTPTPTHTPSTITYPTFQKPSLRVNHLQSKGPTLPTQSWSTSSKTKLPKPSLLPPPPPQNLQWLPQPMQPLQPTATKQSLPPPLPKKEKMCKKPCYHYNPHLNVDNKVIAKKYNCFLYNSLARHNSKPVSKKERILNKIRAKFQLRNKITATPSLHKSKNVIYCIYNNKKHINKIYIGQTKHTAYVRLQQHIHTYNNAPLHTYMQNNNPKSFRIFVLQQITPENLNKAEMYWITKMQTQINNNNPDNLNFIHHLLTSRNFKKQTKIPQERTFASRNYTHRILFLHKIPEKQIYLNTLHPNSLRKMLSVLTNKTIQPVIPRRLTRPTIYLQHTLPPTATITKQHKLINNKLNKIEIKNHILMLTNTLHTKLNPKIKKQIIKIPISTTFISPSLNHKTLKQIFSKTSILLPHNIKEKIDTSIVYKNLDTIGALFFNYKATALSQPNKLTEKPTCTCHNPNFATFLNKHGHIDTNDTEILSIFENFLKIKTTNLKEIAKKGANFIIQPYITPQLLYKYFNKDITKFIHKITQQHKLPSYIFDEW
jgi:hypothetical protein